MIITKHWMTLCAAALCAALALPVQAREGIYLATTTSTENSGLLAHLLPAFEASSGRKVFVVALGSGAALALARRGDADLVLVHARADEDKFMAEGHGAARRDLMYNDFVIACAATDPAGIRGGSDPIAAFKKIAASGVKFVSRGDRSGTETMEQSYWLAAGVRPASADYIAAGRGMGEVLTMAAELQACTLSDRATYATYQAKTGLAIMVQGDARLFNPYGVITVNPQRHPGVNSAGAQALMEWLLSPQGQHRIASFRPGGQQLFFPSARPTP